VLWVLEKVGDVFWTRVLRVRPRELHRAGGVLNTLLANRA
jgi:hypothetical protein